MSVSKHHGRPPPGIDAQRNSEIDEKVEHTDYDLWNYAAAYPIPAYYHHIEVKFVVGCDAAEHDVPAVQDQWHANDVNDLIDKVVVELAVVEDHVVHVDTK